MNSITGGLPQQLYIVYTPKNAASGAIDYEVPVGGGDTKVRVHLDANYASSQYSFQLEPTKTEPSFIVNGRVALADIAVGEQQQGDAGILGRATCSTGPTSIAARPRTRRRCSTITDRRWFRPITAASWATTATSTRRGPGASSSARSSERAAGIAKNRGHAASDSEVAKAASSDGVAPRTLDKFSAGMRRGKAASSNLGLRRGRPRLCVCAPASLVDIPPRDGGRDRD